MNENHNNQEKVSTIKNQMAKIAMADFNGSALNMTSSWVDQTKEQQRLQPKQAQIVTDPELQVKFDRNKQIISILDTRWKDIDNFTLSIYLDSTDEGVKELAEAEFVRRNTPEKFDVTYPTEISHLDSHELGMNLEHPDYQAEYLKENSEKNWFGKAKDFVTGAKDENGKDKPKNWFGKALDLTAGALKRTVGAGLDQRNGWLGGFVSRMANMKDLEGKVPLGDKLAETSDKLRNSLSIDTAETWANFTDKVTNSYSFSYTNIDDLKSNIKTELVTSAGDKGFDVMLRQISGQTFWETDILEVIKNPSKDQAKYDLLVDTIASKIDAYNAVAELRKVVPEAMADKFIGLQAASISKAGIHVADPRSTGVRTLIGMGLNATPLAFLKGLSTLGFTVESYHSQKQNIAEQGNEFRLDIRKEVLTNDLEFRNFLTSQEIDPDNLSAEQLTQIPQLLGERNKTLAAKLLKLEIEGVVGLYIEKSQKSSELQEGQDKNWMNVVWSGLKRSVGLKNADIRKLEESVTSLPALLAANQQMVAEYKAKFESDPELANVDLNTNLQDTLGFSSSEEASQKYTWANKNLVDKARSEPWYSEKNLKNLAGNVASQAVSSSVQTGIFSAAGAVVTGFKEGSVGAGQADFLNKIGWDPQANAIQNTLNVAGGRELARMADSTGKAFTLGQSPVILRGIGNAFENFDLSNNGGRASEALNNLWGKSAATTSMMVGGENGQLGQATISTGHNTALMNEGNHYYQKGDLVISSSVPMNESSAKQLLDLHIQQNAINFDLSSYGKTKDGEYLVVNSGVKGYQLENNGGKAYSSAKLSDSVFAENFVEGDSGSIIRDSASGKVFSVVATTEAGGLVLREVDLNSGVQNIGLASEFTRELQKRQQDAVQRGRNWNLISDNDEAGGGEEGGREEGGGEEGGGKEGGGENPSEVASNPVTEPKAEVQSTQEPKSEPRPSGYETPIRQVVREPEPEVKVSRGQEVNNNNSNQEKAEKIRTTVRQKEPEPQKVAYKPTESNNSKWNDDNKSKTNQKHQPVVAKNPSIEDQASKFNKPEQTARRVDTTEKTPIQEVKRVVAKPLIQELRSRENSWVNQTANQENVDSSDVNPILPANTNQEKVAVKPIVQPESELVENPAAEVLKKEFKTSSRYTASQNELRSKLFANNAKRISDKYNSGQDLTGYEEKVQGYLAHKALIAEYVAKGGKTPTDQEISEALAESNGQIVKDGVNNTLALQERRSSKVSVPLISDQNGKLVGRSDAGKLIQSETAIFNKTIKPGEVIPIGDSKTPFYAQNTRNLKFDKGDNVAEILNRPYTGFNFAQIKLKNGKFENFYSNNSKDVLPFLRQQGTKLSEVDSVNYTNLQSVPKFENQNTPQVQAILNSPLPKAKIETNYQVPSAINLDEEMAKSRKNIGRLPEADRRIFNKFKGTVRNEAILQISNINDLKKVESEVLSTYPELYNQLDLAYKNREITYSQYIQYKKIVLSDQTQTQAIFNTRKLELSRYFANNKVGNIGIPTTGVPAGRLGGGREINPNSSAPTPDQIRNIPHDSNITAQEKLTIIDQNTTTLQKERSNLQTQLRQADITGNYAKGDRLANRLGQNTRELNAWSQARQQIIQPQQTSNTATATYSDGNGSSSNPTTYINRDINGVPIQPTVSVSEAHNARFNSVNPQNPNQTVVPTVGGGERGVNQNLGIKPPEGFVPLTFKTNIDSGVVNPLIEVKVKAEDLVSLPGSSDKSSTLITINDSTQKLVFTKNQDGSYKALVESGEGKYYTLNTADPLVRQSLAADPNSQKLFTAFDPNKDIPTSKRVRTLENTVWYDPKLPTDVVKLNKARSEIVIDNTGRTLNNFINTNEIPVIMSNETKKLMAEFGIDQSKLDEFTDGGKNLNSAVENLILSKASKGELTEKQSAALSRYALVTKEINTRLGASGQKDSILESRVASNNSALFNRGLESMSPQDRQAAIAGQRLMNMLDSEGRLTPNSARNGDFIGQGASESKFVQETTGALIAAKGLTMAIEKDGKYVNPSAFGSKEWSGLVDRDGLPNSFAKVRNKLDSTQVAWIKEQTELAKQGKGYFGLSDGTIANIQTEYAKKGGFIPTRDQIIVASITAGTADFIGQSGSINGLSKIDGVNPIEKFDGYLLSNQFPGQKDRERDNASLLNNLIDRYTKPVDGAYAPDTKVSTSIMPTFNQRRLYSPLSVASAAITMATGGNFMLGLDATNTKSSVAGFGDPKQLDVGSYQVSRDEKAGLMTVKYNLADSRQSSVITGAEMAYIVQGITGRFGVGGGFSAQTEVNGSVTPVEVRMSFENTEGAQQNLQTFLKISETVARSPEFNRDDTSLSMYQTELANKALELRNQGLISEKEYKIAINLSSNQEVVEALFKQKGKIKGAGTFGELVSVRDFVERRGEPLSLTNKISSVPTVSGYTIGQLTSMQSSSQRQTVSNLFNATVTENHNIPTGDAKLLEAALTKAGRENSRFNPNSVKLPQGYNVVLAGQQELINSGYFNIVTKPDGSEYIAYTTVMRDGKVEARLIPKNANLSWHVVKDANGNVIASMRNTETCVGNLDIPIKPELSRQMEIQSRLDCIERGICQVGQYEQIKAEFEITKQKEAQIKSVAANSIKQNGHVFTGPAMQLVQATYRSQESNVKVVNAINEVVVKYSANGNQANFEAAAIDLEKRTGVKVTKEFVARVMKSGGIFSDRILAAKVDQKYANTFGASIGIGGVPGFGLKFGNEQTINSINKGELKITGLTVNEQGEPCVSLAVTSIGQEHFHNKKEITLALTYKTPQPDKPDEPAEGLGKPKPKKPGTEPNTLDRSTPGSTPPGTGPIPRSGQLPNNGINTITPPTPTSLPLQPNGFPTQTLNPNLGQTFIPTQIPASITPVSGLNATRILPNLGAATNPFTIPSSLPRF